MSDFNLVLTLATRPKMDELICMKERDGSGRSLRIIDWITSSSRAHCGAFAHMLLRDTVSVQKLQKKNQDDDEFVPAVLNEWLSRHNPADGAVPRTWEALAVCVEEAGLDGTLAKAIRDNCPKGIATCMLSKLPLGYTKFVGIVPYLGHFRGCGG